MFDFCKGQLTSGLKKIAWIKSKPHSKQVCFSFISLFKLVHIIVEFFSIELVAMHFFLLHGNTALVFDLTRLLAQYLQALKCCT